MKQPLGYEVESHEQNCYRLRKVLYGIKKNTKTWYSRIKSYMIKNGFSGSNIEPTFYTKVNEHGKILIVCSRVDDMIYSNDLQLE